MTGTTRVPRLLLPLLLVVTLFGTILPVGRTRAAGTGLPTASAGAPPAMPLISRGVPAFASSAGNPASSANDSDYSTFWVPGATPSAGSPQWLAYNLAGVPAAQRGPVVVGISNDPTTSDYYQSSAATYYALPSDYTLEANAAPGGGSAPTTGWVTLATVTGNVYNGRMHQLDLTGYSWLRLSITASRNGAPALNLDVFDAGAGAQDTWLLLGDSITAEGAAHANISGSAWSGGNLTQLIAAARPGYSPLILDGGTGGMNMDWAAQNVATLLAPFSGRYVGIVYGTNDANNSGALSSSQISAYYQDLLTVVDAVQARGMVAVVPTIIWGCASGGWLGTNAQTLNTYVAARLWVDRPQVVHGPDLYSYFQANQGLLRDCIHPTYTASGGALNGYEQWQRLWRDALLANVYAGGVGMPSPTPSPSSSPSPTPRPSSSPSPSTCGQRFADMPANDLACVAVEALASLGIVNGCDPTAVPPRFCPADPTLREQLAALIVRAMPGWQGETWPNSFTDQTADAELMRRVGTLQHYQVAGGYNDCPAQGKTAPCYGPLDPVLRAQAMSFVTRAMVARGYWTKQPGNPQLYGGALNGTGHEADAATYWYYTRAQGGVPDYPEAGSFPVDEAAPRAWFARLLWTAIQGSPAAP